MNHIDSYENDFSTKETNNHINYKLFRNTANIEENFQSGHKRGFGKFKRKLIFLLIFLINIIINFDHGAIPAATTTLMTNLNLDHVAIGVLGSLVFLGLTLGACCAGPLFNNYAPKWIVSAGIIAANLFLYYFTQATTAVGLGICRVGCGFFQVFCLIYFPVWVDHFGVYESRTMWLSFLQLGAPLGTMLGYVIEAFAIGVFQDVRNKLIKFSGKLLIMFKYFY